MPGPWISGPELEPKVAQILKVELADLEDYWPPLCVDAADQAYADLSGILLGKGYTTAQLDSWDFRKTYSRQQALFWLFTETTLGIGQEDRDILKLDHRKELKESATIVVNGSAVGPDTGAGNTAGGVGGGVIDPKCRRFGIDEEW